VSNTLASIPLIAAADVVGGGSFANTPWYVWSSYLVAAAMFVLALKWLSHPRSARRGVRAGEIGMVLAIVGTLLMYFGASTTLKWVFIAMVLGSLIGAPMAIWMPMTAVPQRTALSHAFGALAAALVGTAHYYDFFGTAKLDQFTMAILARVRQVFPGLANTGSVAFWAGLRPATPSNVPLIGRTRYRNLFLNTGHGTLGWTLACGSARVLTDVVSGREPQVAFRLQ